MPPIIFIPDTSAIISLGQLLSKYRLFERLKEAGFKIVIPLYLYEKEAEYISTLYVIDELIKNDIIELGDRNSTTEIIKFIEDNPRMHRGETHVIFDYQKEEGHIVVYCIFDDKDAQNYAKKHGVRYISSRNLVLWLKEMGLISLEEEEEILLILDTDNKTISQ